MPRAAPLDQPHMTPLAPSVEKAYYRKCIQLKRRLNEVEAANDETKLRRLRLDRAIMKMRLERAFLLDELRRRMDEDVDGSDASGDEGMATPPPDRPHRDKRRRQQTSQAPQAAIPPTNSLQSATNSPSAQRTAVDVEAGTPTAQPQDRQDMQTSNAIDEGQHAENPPLSHGSPYNAPPTGAAGSASNEMEIDSTDPQDARPISREAGTTGEPVGTGPTVVEENGERKVLPEDDPAESGEDGRGALMSSNN